MTSTAERIQLLAEACALSCVEKWIGKITARDLKTWLAAELGSATALDDFRPHGPIQSKAMAPKDILHILSGNTPHAAIQSLIRGLLLGSHNTFKIPSSGLPEFIECTEGIPAPLNQLIEIHDTLTEEHWSRANAIIAIGSDASINAIHQKALAHQIFIPHGHKLSIGIVYNDFKNAARLAARDISLYNQRGCLSLHAIYAAGDSRSFAGLLAQEMEHFCQQNPPEPINLSEAGAVRNLRETIRFCAANDPSTQLWESQDSLNWSVVHENSATLKLSCLNRCVYVKPLPPILNTQILGPEAQHLSTIATHPFSCTEAAALTNLTAHRICPLGTSQQPSLFWHHDGFAPLASLVKWTDLG